MDFSMILVRTGNNFAIEKYLIVYTFKTDQKNIYAILRRSVPLIRRCAVRTYTVPYGAVRSNRTRVELRRRSHYARRRTSPFWCYRGNRVVFYFCGILPYGAVEPHGSAVLPVDLYGFSEPLKLFFQKKINTNFPRPYAIRRCKELLKSSTPCTNDAVRCPRA